jgi:hypothetical protein
MFERCRSSLAQVVSTTFIVSGEAAFDICRWGYHAAESNLLTDEGRALSRGTGQPRGAARLSWKLPADRQATGKRADVWVEGDGVLRVELALGSAIRGAFVRVCDAEEVLALIAEASRDADCRCLVDVRRVVGGEPRARRMAPAPNVKRMAILVGNPVTKVLARAYLGVVGTPIPMRIFRDADKAMGWLHADEP